MIVEAIYLSMVPVSLLFWTAAMADTLIGEL